MAHFLEHMIFMGSKNYPKAGEFDEFISKNSGSSNAFTDWLETNYYFDCSNAAFYETLDRFVDLMDSPLFSKDHADKEKNAVDSEYNLGYKSDYWRTE